MRFICSQNPIFIRNPFKTSENRSIAIEQRHNLMKLETGCPDNALRNVTARTPCSSGECGLGRRHLPGEYGWLSIPFFMYSICINNIASSPFSADPKHRISRVHFAAMVSCTCSVCKSGKLFWSGCVIFDGTRQEDRNKLNTAARPSPPWKIAFIIQTKTASGAFSRKSDVIISHNIWASWHCLRVRVRSSSWMRFESNCCRKVGFSRSCNQCNSRRRRRAPMSTWSQIKPRAAVWRQTAWTLVETRGVCALP